MRLDDLDPSNNTRDHGAGGGGFSMGGGGGGVTLPEPPPPPPPHAVRARPIAMTNANVVDRVMLGAPVGVGAADRQGPPNPRQAIVDSTTSVS